MKKQTFLIPIVALGASLASCGGGGKKPTIQYDVNLKMTEAMNLENPVAVSNKNYDTKITVKDDFAAYCAVPEKLLEVHVDGVQLAEGEQYTYTRTGDDEASLHIPAKNVTGDIEIFAEAKADKVHIELNDSYPVKYLAIDQKESTVGSSCEVNFSLTESEEVAKYSVPEKLSDLSVVCKDEGDDKEYDLTPCCTYVKNDDTSSKLTIPAKYNGVVVITGAITITATAYQPIYTIKNGELDNLTTDYTVKGEVKKGIDYEFGLTATSGVIPDVLSIKVGGDLLSKFAGDYKIETTNSTQATVTIFAEKIVDDIVVSGSALPQPPATQYAPVEYYLGGIEELPEEKRQAEVNKVFTCELKSAQGAEAVQADDIRVKIGDSKDPEAWKIPTEGTDIEFDVDNCTLKVSEQLIKSTSDTVHIAAKAHNVKLLEFYSSQGDWASIETAANLGYAPYLFDIGEESVPFSLNDSTSNMYRIRIIGFNKDKNYLYENTAGITFEFTSCVSQQYFGKSTSAGTYSTYFYKKSSETGYQSELYDYLNTTLYNALPFKKYLNNIRKYTVAGSFGTTDDDKKAIMKSGNYLFPLSLKEMGLESTIEKDAFKNEGVGEGHNEAYPYYDGTHSLVKTDGTNPVTYWLRSPANLKNPQIYTINTDGHRASAPARGQKLYVAPAFCF